MGVTGLILVGLPDHPRAGQSPGVHRPRQINRYAAMLHAHGRRALGGPAGAPRRRSILHVVAAIQLTLRRQAARPIGVCGRAAAAGLDARRRAR